MIEYVIPIIAGYTDSRLFPIILQVFALSLIIIILRILREICTI